MILTAYEKATIDTFIGRTSVAAVLFAVAEICREKAHHFAANWEDPAQARGWDEVNAIVRRASVAVHERLGAVC